MFPLEQSIVHKYRSFWCGIALKHGREFHSAFGLEKDWWWQDDLPEQVIQLPVITKAIWDEMVARSRLSDAIEAYNEARSRFSGELDEKEIGDWELGSVLKIRGGGP